MLRGPLLSTVAVVALVVGQWIAFAHEASTRHVTCAKHGEELEAAILVGADDQCQHEHWVAVERAGGDHVPCTLSQARHQSATRTSLAPAPTIVVELAADAPIAHTLRSFAALYLLAPKTSPPAMTVTA